MIKPEFQPLVFSDIVYGYENLEVNEDYVWDAGPGIALNDIFGGDFRIMFPLWMNPSPISENIYDFRWVVSFTPKFEY
jgi:hypothetical protein